MDHDSGPNARSASRAGSGSPSSPVRSRDRHRGRLYFSANGAGDQAHVLDKIEHRLFSFISQNWRGKPLISSAVILSLIAATTTETGLTVESRLDTNRYPAGRKITDAEMAALRLERDAFHGEWNYTLVPHAAGNGAVIV